MSQATETEVVTDPVSTLPDNFDGVMEQMVARAVSGEASVVDLAVLRQHPDRWRATLERLLVETEESLERLLANRNEDTEQIIADFEDERDRLADALADLLGLPRPSEQRADEAADDDLDEFEWHAETVEPVELEAPGECRLQLSWAAGRVVAWAAGPDATPASADELADRLAALGAPGDGWQRHRGLSLPGGGHAAGQAISIDDALGWLVSLAADRPDDDGALGASAVWMGRVALWAVQLVADGRVVPSVRVRQRGRRAAAADRSAGVDHLVRWLPALVDPTRLEALAAAMPGTVGALERADARARTQSLLSAIVDAIVTDAASRIELPAPPPTPRTNAEVAEAVLTRLDGSAFLAPPKVGGEVANRLERWARPVTADADRLTVQLDPPDQGDAWYLSVLGLDPEGVPVPVEVALVDSRSSRRTKDELERLERLLPAVARAGGRRRGEVYLSTDEAWELMTVTGPALRSAGFDVRVPALSRRRPAPSLRLTAEASDPSVVGAHQLADVRWSAVFDDVELTAADIARLAAEARPLVRSRGRWVELDKADLAEAAAALADRADRTRLTAAEVLRHAIGLEGAALRGGTSVGGTGWAADLLARAERSSSEPVAHPEGFVGELRSYQAEAVGWLGFLDGVELGGCLALDMGLGKTPTVLAHLARSAADDKTALVIAPPAVVGNWAAEAARFAPGLRVVVHHGTSRATAEELEAEVAGADVLITTYGTAVRDIDALCQHRFDRVVLDEAQAIKNPTSDVAQQLRRLDARMRLALTGTPIENGLGDLWALLDWANPGLVGTRSAFVGNLSTDGSGGRDGAERALRTLNGILVFRRTKAEPEVAAELPERIDELDHCTMTDEQIGLYQAVLDKLVTGKVAQEEGGERQQGEILAAITALKQICNHPAAYQDDGRPLHGRSGKLARLEEIVDNVFEAGEKVLVFTHFAEWGKRLADHLTERTGVPIACYHGGLARGARDRIIEEFQAAEGAGALVLSLKAGGTGLNLTAASHVVLYDRWWNPAVEDQARDRAWRIGQTRTVISHRLVCPGTVDERVEQVVAGKRHIADMVLPKSSSLSDLDSTQLQRALGLRPEELLTDEDLVNEPEGAS